MSARLGLGRGVAVALEDSEINIPWANGFSMLTSHDACKLVEMVEVVSGPGSQQLREGDGSERWVQSAP